MHTEIQEGQQATHQKTVVVKVRYIAARQRFIDPHAEQKETLTSLKPRVLDFFSLVEGTADGGTKTYYFSLDGITQTDLGATLGTLAEGKHELTLDLLERFEQG